jgi:hypothetical protein
MDNAPSPEPQNQATETVEPEVLKPRADDGTPTPEAAPSAEVPTTPEAGKRPRRRTYRPSHKATFIGLAVVVLILTVNAVILGFVLKGKGKSTDQLANGQVTISKGVLNKIGVNTSTIGDSGVVLVVSPNAQFNGKMTVAGDVNIAGQLKLNSKFIASDANLTQLEAGNTSLSQLNVSGNSTLSNLALTVSQLLTVNNNLNVAGNLAVGGTLSTKTFSANSLTSTSTLTVGGHIITAGPAPGVGPGSALGSNGTVSINGNDAAGTIAINIGAGAGAGTLVNVAFRTQYGNVPRVVISPVNIPPNVTCSFYVLNPSPGGFSVEDSCGLPPGGFAIDYIIEQ